MSIKEDFRGYREARRAIERDKRRLDSAQCLTDTVKGSSAEWPYTSHPMTVSGRNAADEREILRRITRNKAICARVEMAIRKAPNDKIRDILTLRYVEGMSWAEVAELRAGDDERAPGASAMRKAAERYIDGL